jgi:drug/metabolite transporter (DMT)-like permease
MDSERRAQVRAELLLLLVVTIWACNYPVAKYGISGLNLYIFNALRFVTAALLIAFVYFARSPWIPIRKADWPALIRAGLVANVLYQVAFILGLSLTTAGNSAILLATAPLWTVVIYSRIQKEKIGRQIWLGMPVSLLGIVMVVLGSTKKVELGTTALIGDLICVGAAFLWAFNTNLQKPLLLHYSPTQVAFVMVSIGAIGLSLFAISPAMSTAWSSIHWTYIAAALVSGTLAIGASNVMWSYGVKRLGPNRTGNFGNLIPILALGVSYVTLGEQLSFIQAGGTAMTLFGVWFARR